MEQKTAETLKSLAVTTIRLDPPAGRDALRRPAAVGRRRQGRAVELEARDPRRADGGARRRADRAGARARPPARRAGARGRDHLAQPPRRLRDGDPHHRAAARPERRRLRARARRRSRRSSQAITAGVPTKVSGIPDGRRRRRRDHGRRRRRARTRRRHRRRRSSRRSRRPLPARVGQPQVRATSASFPIVVGIVFIVVFFGFKATNFFTANNFDNLIIQMAGTAMLAYGVVFVLLLGEIDLSISYVAGHRRAHRRGAPAARQRARGQRAARDGHRGRGLRRDRRRSGLDRRVRRRALVRRHARAAS